ncbi:MAG: InlB B-repeat-containing protein [Candidatus Bathyarchaeota archaeon]|nr:InlB B-repeat-containing protein [Candidatus Termiticorpusculum sp.]
MNDLALNLKATAKNSARNLHSKNVFYSVVSLLFVLVLLSSCLASVFSGVSFFVSGADVSVVDQDTLRAAVIGAPTGLGVSSVIVLYANISITGSLGIPADKNITLKNVDGDICRLIGMSDNAHTIIVNGALTLDGITVTHVAKSVGCGVFVSSGGTLVMLSGEISGLLGSGVRNEGTFEMYAGLIANNTCDIFALSGGGVSNAGTFKMYGGVITNNTGDRAGGVANGGSVSMYGGKITNNFGSGIYSVWPGSASMNGGEITNNTAWAGGGVYNNGAIFSLFDGKISDNRATNGGGGAYSTGEFNMFGGTISGNNAPSGGGIYIGNDVIRSSVCHLSGGIISNNKATGNGGGVWVTDDCSYLERLFVSNDVIFQNNLAYAAYNRAPVFDDIYNLQIGSKVTWTSPFTQGYNNYDISYVYGTSLTQYSVTVHDSYASITGADNYSTGISVTINAGSRDGYTFSGWTVNEGGISLSNSATATFTMPARDVVLTANWSPISYTISYVLNSGTNAAGNPSSYNVGSTLPITITNPSMSGYEFLGWNVLYANGSQVSSQSSYRIPAGTTGNIELTANWCVVDSGGSDGGGNGGSGGGDSSPKPSPSPSVPSEPTPSSPEPSNEIIADPNPWPTTRVQLVVALVIVVLVVVGVVVLLLWKGSKV